LAPGRQAEAGTKENTHDSAKVSADDAFGVNDKTEVDESYSPSVCLA
jgi:hypothetical protein